MTHPAPTGPFEWLNFHHLRYFWVVAREGSVSRAAAKLRVTQPTVSEQIHALQDALGEELFRREGRGLVVTEAGSTVFRFAEEIFDLGGELIDAVKGRPSGRPQRLAVGIADVVPKLVAFRILEPALAMPERVRLVCREDAQEPLPSVRGCAAQTQREAVVPLAGSAQQRKPIW